MLAHAADRQQGDLGRFDAEAPRREDMAEFVQDDAHEEKHDEDDAVARRGRALLAPRAETNPGEQQQEGDVDLHRRLAKAAYRQRPAHGSLLDSSPLF